MVRRYNLTFAEFKALLDEPKRRSDPIFCRLFLRPLSFPVGWLLYKVGVNANSISLLSILFAIVSSIYWIVGSAQYIFIASFLMLLVSLTDCIDGNLARARGETGPGGEWMDALSGYTVYALLPMSLGIHLSAHSSYVDHTKLWLILGAVSTIANLFQRLVYQKFLSSTMRQFSEIGIQKQGYYFARFSGEMGLVGWMMPVLVLASITNKLELYLVTYCCFYLVSAILVTVVLVRKVI